MRPNLKTGYAGQNVSRPAGFSELAVADNVETDGGLFPDDFRNGLADSHNNLGILLRDTGRLDDAEHHP